MVWSTLILHYNRIDVNDAPTITLSKTSATEDSAYSYTFIATDNSDTLTLSAPTNPPTNANTGVLSGTPTQANIGHNVVLKVKDNSGAVVRNLLH